MGTDIAIKENEADSNGICHNTEFMSKGYEKIPVENCCLSTRSAVQSIHGSRLRNDS